MKIYLNGQMYTTQGQLLGKLGFLIMDTLYHNPVLVEWHGDLKPVDIGRTAARAGYQMRWLPDGYWEMFQ